MEVAKCFQICSQIGSKYLVVQFLGLSFTVAMSIVILFLFFLSSCSLMKYEHFICITLDNLVYYKISFTNPNFLSFVLWSYSVNIVKFCTKKMDTWQFKYHFFPTPLQSHIFSKLWYFGKSTLLQLWHKSYTFTDKFHSIIGFRNIPKRSLEISVDSDVT